MRGAEFRGCFDIKIVVEEVNIGLMLLLLFVMMIIMMILLVMMIVMVIMMIVLLWLRLDFPCGERWQFERFGSREEELLLLLLLWDDDFGG